MALTMQGKQHVGKEVSLRYLRARKKEKGIMLQEFCATTGYSPPYAAYLPRTYAKRVILGGTTLVPTRPSPCWHRQRKHVYGPAVVEALVWMYHLAGELCGKRLQAAIPELLHATLLHMGSATMDRLLREEKAKGGNRKHCSRTKPGSLLGLIPVVFFRELSTASPGYVEVDLVSHGGGKVAGDRCYTLTVTDRCSGWTEIVPVSSHAQAYVFAALTTALSHLPSPVLVLHSDNGSEFINDELRRFCDAHGIRFTRSRPWHKNDNCYVESKNWTLVRSVWDTAGSIHRVSSLT
ncbi:MAG TPA: DDE-type integrase/transposase/recombinase [Candidatus Cryosericum sp.]